MVMFGNKMSPFLESGTDLTRQSQMCRSTGESGRAEGRKVKVGDEIASPHTRTSDIGSRELSPKANSLGQALKCFIFAWISNVDSSWAELTKLLKAPLYVLLCELPDTHLHTHLPVRT